MRYRVGAFGTVNAVLGVVFFVAFSALVAVAGLALGTETDVVWSLIACAFSLVAAVLMALLAASGFSTWRAVELTTNATGTAVLSVPGFTARRGFYRDSVDVANIIDVRLVYLAQPRNGRWQLVVTRRGAPPLRCDSITSSRKATADVRSTAAWRAVEQLREHVRAAGA